MTTTTSTTSSASATASIVKQLGSGSGIDVGALVTSLVEAQFAARTAQLTQKNDANETRISTAGELKSGMSGFATALQSLVRGGTLSPLATSSDTAIVTATALPGATLAQKTTQLKVTALAAQQTANLKAYIANPATSQGTGTLTFQLGTATVNTSGAMTAFTAGASPAVTVTIDAASSSLTGIVDKINAANAGVTASIATDASGSRLVLTGATGAAQAFTVAVTENASARGLAKFAVGVNKTTMAVPQAATDASITMNGVVVKRSSNTVTDLVEGVKLELQSINATKVVTIGATRQLDNLKQAVSDFVATYNELKGVLSKAIDPKGGALAADPAAQSMTRALSSLVTTQIVTGVAAGAPRTLAEIGVKTNRDGTLAIDELRLADMLAKQPDAIEKMFAAGSGATGNGLSAALKSVSDRVTSVSFGLGASVDRYTRVKSTIADQQLDASDDASRLRERLTKQFAAMDARVAAYKATQSFLENQVKIWTKSGD